MNELRDVFINFIIREAVDFALIDWMHITYGFLRQAWICQDWRLIRSALS